jgi:hypothetical protein
MHKEKNLRLYLIAALAEGVFSIMLLLLIPRDPKNARLLGLSWTRLVMLAGIITCLFVPAFYLNKANKDQDWLKGITHKITQTLQYDGNITLGLITSLSGFIGGGYLLFITITTTDAFLKGYYVRLAPALFWFTALCGQTILFFAYGEANSWKRYIQTHKFPIVILIVILAFGLAVHQHLWVIDPDEQRNLLIYDEELFDVYEQDIHWIFQEGQRLINKENPYARVLEGDTIRWNQGYATHLPLFYYFAWLTQAVGLQDFIQWLSFWRVIFLLFNLGVAYTLFHVSHHRFRSTILAIFAGIFWLFNRWTLHLTMIYHVDFLAIFFMILSLSTMPTRKKLAYVLFGVSLSIKHLALFLIPLYLIWAWNSANENRFKEVLIAGILIACVPLISSLPFLVWNAEGLVKSILVSITRLPEGHFGAPSLDALLGLLGIPAKIPMIGMLLLVYIMTWKGKTSHFSGAFLVMLIFIDFNSVVFRQYMTWISALIPLAIGEMLPMPLLSERTPED